MAYIYLELVPSYLNFTLHFSNSAMCLMKILIIIFILCVTLKYPIFLSFHLLNQEEMMSSNYFPWGFTNFLDCIFCALSKQYSTVV